jgi:hypothetical protein
MDQTLPQAACLWCVLEIKQHSQSAQHRRALSRLERKLQGLVAYRRLYSFGATIERQAGLR